MFTYTHIHTYTHTYIHTHTHTHRRANRDEDAKHPPPSNSSSPYSVDTRMSGTLSRLRDARYLPGVNPVMKENSGLLVKENSGLLMKEGSGLKPVCSCVHVCMRVFVYVCVCMWICKGKFGTAYEGRLWAQAGVFLCACLYACFCIRVCLHVDM